MTPGSGAGGKCRPGQLVQALRLPFTTASILPYICGAMLAPAPFRSGLFLLGLLAVTATHLSANVINDYADARSGVDGLNPGYYGFFGGSKLIQQGILPARFFLLAGLVLAVAAALSVLLCALLLGRPGLVLIFAMVCLAGWAYSCPPAALAYHGLGELTIFLLFGTATVCGAYILQADVITADALLLSLPHGFLVAGILIANEVPDAQEDQLAQKRTLVVRIGAQRGYLLYALLVFLAAASVVVLVLRNTVPPAGLLAIPAFGLPATSATLRLRRAWADKLQLVQASKLAIAAHIAASLAIIASLAFMKG